jgi:hypothetical protein
MKQHIYYFLFFTTIGLTSVSVGQNKGFSIGFRSSYLGEQTQNSNELSGSDHPVLMGIQLRTRTTQDCSLQLSSEYWNGDNKQQGGKETDLQTSLTALVFPLRESRISPYLSAGLLMSVRSTDDDKTTSKLKLVLGGGLDIPLNQRVFITAGAGIITNGWKYQGWNSSMGLGYAL